MNIGSASKPELREGFLSCLSTAQPCTQCCQGLLPKLFCQLASLANMKLKLPSNTKPGYSSVPMTAQMIAANSGPPVQLSTRLRVGSWSLRCFAARPATVMLISTTVWQVPPCCENNIEIFLRTGRRQLFWSCRPLSRCADTQFPRTFPRTHCKTQKTTTIGSDSWLSIEFPTFSKDSASLPCLLQMSHVAISGGPVFAIVGCPDQDGKWPLYGLDVCYRTLPQ